MRLPGAMVNIQPSRNVETTSRQKNSGAKLHGRTSEESIDSIKTAVPPHRLRRHGRIAV